MNKNNIITIAVIGSILCLLYYIMHIQVKGAEQMLESVSIPKEPSSNTMQSTTKEQVQKTASKTKPIIYVEVDDGLEVPPDEVEEFVGD